MKLSTSALGGLIISIKWISGIVARQFIIYNSRDLKYFYDKILLSRINITCPRFCFRGISKGCSCTGED